MVMQRNDPRDSSHPCPGLVELVDFSQHVLTANNLSSVRDGLADGLYNVTEDVA